MKHIYIEHCFTTRGGSSIESAAREAIEVMEKLSPQPTACWLIFNNVALEISVDTNPVALMLEYDKKTSGTNTEPKFNPEWWRR
jgi:hypothetical protein